MLRMACPYCGVRDETEFAFGGETAIARPTLECTDAEWMAYLYLRANPRGLHRERWLHRHGCRQWFNAIRDTVNHHIVGTYRMDERLPTIDEVAT